MKEAIEKGIHNLVETAYQAGYEDGQKHELTWHWIKKWQDGEERFYCSACRKYELFMSDYCPNCGAKMRKVGKQDDKDSL